MFPHPVQHLLAAARRGHTARIKRPWNLRVTGKSAAQIAEVPCPSYGPAETSIRNRPVLTSCPVVIPRGGRGGENAASNGRIEAANVVLLPGAQSVNRKVRAKKR
jgi:hypothetical protein